MDAVVIKPFCLAGKRQEVGSVVKLGEAEAREFAFRGLVSLSLPPASAPAAAVTEEAPAVAGGRRSQRAEAADE